MSIALGILVGVVLGKVLLRLFVWNSWRTSERDMARLKQHARDGSWLALIWLGLAW